MVIILNKDQFSIPEQAQEYMGKIDQGAVFVYGTDTIYGIGCNALDSEAVKKIRIIKGRDERPFSVIAPSLSWIIKNCEVTPAVEEWLQKLPGPITLILKLKNKNAVAKEVLMGKDTIGVRIPGHWFTQVVEALELPVVTTSVNKTGKLFMTSLDDIDHEIKNKLDFIIEEGTIGGRPSKIVHLDKEELEVRER